MGAHLGQPVLAWLLVYVCVIGTILVVDAVWLGMVAKKFYANQLGNLMRPDIKALPSLAFYLLFAAGLVILAVRPDDASTSIREAAFLGGLVGFIAYGTYNMTNYATLKDWPIKMTAVDWPFGTALSALAAIVGRYVRVSIG